MNLLLVLALTALLIDINAIYVAAEFATVASRKTRISQMAANGNSMANAMLPLMENRQTLDRYIAACQLGITASSLVLGAYGQRTVAVALEPTITSWLATIAAWNLPIDISAQLAADSFAATAVLLLFTVLQVLLGELVPKSVAVQYPEQVALALVYPMKLSMQLLRPLIWFFNGSGILILRLLGYSGVDGEHGNNAHSAAEIELLVRDSYRGGLLDDEERQMLRNAFRMRDLTARQIMVHRTRLFTAADTTSVSELIAKSLEGGYSRIPIYGENVDAITGFVHIKDLFRLYLQGREGVDTIRRDVLYVPETMPAVDVWEQMRKKHHYTAIVFDEYGGTAGLITIEDLIEEIFGDLQDEFDNEESQVSIDNAGRAYLRGDLLVADINEYFDLELPPDAADTLSGLVLSLLGHTPTEGEEVEIGSLTLRVEALDDLGVAEVSLEIPSFEEKASQVSEWEVSHHD